MSALKPCRLCGRGKPASEFIAGKGAKARVSSTCADCRKRLAKRHAQNWYRALPPDKRHTLTHKKRAAAYGVEHKPYSRTEILARWDHRCAYCNAPATHLDHVNPLSKGGDDVESNIVPACAGCNLSKGAKTLAEWVASWPMKGE